LPDWYKKAKRYHEEGGSTYKNCVPLFEAMYSGYVMLTPCDIEFYLKEGIPYVNVINNKYESFVRERSPMNDFHTPIGFYDKHFAWLPQWGFEVPKGYNVLYMTPFNGYSLPFINTMGIVNNDKTSHPGSIPFFLKKEFAGIIKKGTPFLQILPIKREDWKSEKKILDPSTITHFKPGTPRIDNLYRDELWERSRYE
jgi:hypothetical protein